LCAAGAVARLRSLAVNRQHCTLPRHSLAFGARKVCAPSRALEPFPEVVIRCDRVRTRPVALAVLVSAMLLVSARHVWPGFTTANESIRLLFVASVVEHHTIALDQVSVRYGSHNVDRAERGGHIYLDKPPGGPLLGLPGYLLWTRVLAASAPRPPPPPLDGVVYAMTVSACLLPALAGLLALAWAARRTGASAVAAAALLLGCLCATPLGLYATQLFGHAPAAAALAGAFALAVASPEPRRLALAGLLGALAVTCEYTAAPTAGALLIYVLHRARLRGALAFAAGALPLAIALGLYHTAAFGHPLATGYAWKANPEFVQHHAHGLFGITLPGAAGLFGVTFSRERGLFFLSPWLLLAIPGLFALWRRPDGRALALLCGFAALFPVLLIAATPYWQGGDCVGPRYLAIAIPFLGWAALAAPSASAHPAWRRGIRVVGGGLAGLSVLQLWFAFATFPFYPPDVPDPVYTVSLPLLLARQLAPSLLPPPLGAVLPPLLVLLAGVALAFGRRRLWVDALAAGGLATLLLVLAAATSPGAPQPALAARQLAISLMAGR
jgi:hypothetical protein